MYSTFFYKNSCTLCRNSYNSRLMKFIVKVIRGVLQTTHSFFVEVERAKTVKQK